MKKTSLWSKARAYLSDPILRAKTTLYSSLAMNLLYAVLNLASGFYYGSTWLISISIYHAFLGLSYFLLLRSAGKREGLQTEREKRLKELHVYRFCGYLLFGIQAVMSGVMAVTVIQDKSYVYPGHIIYLTAASTFFFVVLSIINFSRFRLDNNPIVSTEKHLNLAASLMSLYALEAALLSQFGDDYTYRMMINAGLGAAISLAVLGMALSMVVRANRKLSVTITK